MNPLKLLFLVSDVKESATYCRAFRLARQLASMGHNVTLMCVSRESRFNRLSSIESGVKVIETPNFLYEVGLSGRIWLEAGFGVLDILTRIKEALSFDYDLIQNFDHFHNITLPFHFLRNRVRSKFVSDWCDLTHLPGGLRDAYGFRHDNIYRKIGFIFRRHAQHVEVDLRKKSDAVTVISKKLREIAIENGVENDKVFVVEVGVDVDLVKPLPKMEARKKLGLPVNGRIVEFMGSFQGDLDILLKSFAILKMEIPDSFLLIVGKRYEWTRSLAKTLGIMDSYIEAGRCSDALLPHYLACADVFALPLKNNLANEARWANKFGEYLASGRPVVISDVGDQASIVRKHEVGLVANNSIEHFAKQVMILLQNAELSQKLGRNARKAACEDFSWYKMATKLEHVYQKVLQMG